MVVFYMIIYLLNRFLFILWICLHGSEMFTNFLPPPTAKDFE